MIYFLYGTDEYAIAARARGFRESGGTITHIEGSADVAAIENAAFARELFGGARTVVLEHLCVHAAAKAWLLRELDAMVRASDVFVVVEHRIHPSTAKKITAAAHRTERLDLPDNESRNAFALADAFMSGDKKALWGELVRELVSGRAPEEVHGRLFWAAKTAALARASSSAYEAGLHPFVYRKARAGAVSDATVSAYVRTLARLPHESRRRGIDLSLELEHLVLAV